MTLAEREAIRQRADKATKGPWDQGNAPDLKHAVFNISVVDGLADRVIAQGCSDVDGDFIAHVRSDVPALLAEVERLTTAIEDALTYHQTTHIHAVLRAALPAAEEG